MADAAQIVAAFRDVAANKSLSDEEMTDLVKDGLLAGLARIYGATVQAEIDLNEDTGEFDIVVLRRVVEEVEDPASEISLEEARWDDETYEVGDVMEVPVPFEKFGRNAVMAVKQRIVQRVRENERDRIRDEFADQIGELLSGELQQIERGKLVVMLNRAKDADAIIPWKDQNPRERFRQGDPIRAVLKKVEETPKGPRLILSRADPLFVAALFKLEVPEIYQGIVEIREISREVGGRTKIAVYSRATSRSTRSAPASASRARACRPSSPSSEASASTSCRGTPIPRSLPGGRWLRRGCRRCSAIPSGRSSRRSSMKTSSRSRSGATDKTCGSRRSSSGGRSTCTGSREWLEKRGADLSLFNDAPVG